MSTKLSGTITVHGSKPATTAVVEIHNDNGDVVDQVQVDDRGSYTYHLSPGTWGLRVWDSHGHRAGRQVEIGDQGEKVLDIDLEEPEGGH
jgi:hypothetical protein